MLCDPIITSFTFLFWDGLPSCFAFDMLAAYLACLFTFYFILQFSACVSYNMEYTETC